MACRSAYDLARPTYHRANLSIADRLLRDARRRQSEPARRSTLGVAQLSCNIGLESKSQVHE